MIIETGLGHDFLEELPLGIHTLSEGSPSDTIKLALYGPNANLTRFYPTYTTTGEITGGGYTAGGYDISGWTMIGRSGSGRNGGGLATQFDFAYLQPDVDFQALVSGVSVRGCMVYNASVNNRNIFTLDFGVTLVPDFGLQLLWGYQNVLNERQALIPLKGQTT